MRLRHRVVGAWVVGLLTISGCELGADPDHPAFNHYEGASRLNERGELVVWLGDSCSAVTSLQFELDQDGARTFDTWRIRSRSPRGRTIEYVTPGVVPEGFRETDPLDDDWRDAEATAILVRTRTAQTRSYLAVSSFLEEAEERDPDEWFVQDHGWYTQDGYRDELVGADNADVYPMCATHD